MSDNNKSLSERRNSINDKGPEKWLSRDLEEANRPIISRNILKPEEDQPLGVQEPQRNASLADRVGSVVGKQRSAPPSGGGGLSLPQSGESDNQEPKLPVGKKVVDRIREKFGDNSDIRVTKPIQQIRNQLGDKRGELLERVVDEYSNLYSPENIEKFHGENRFSDAQGALQFMQNQFGMTPGRGGRLGYGTLSPERAIALGQGIPGVKGSREYFGRQFHDIQGSRGDMSHMEGVLGGTAGDINYDGKRKFHANRIINDVNTDMAREVFGQLNRSIQTYLNGLGQPDASSTGVFNPDNNWEMNHNIDNGVPSGDTDFDMKQHSDIPGEVEEWNNAITNGSAGDMRGIMMLQKILSTGFTDEVTGMPLMGGLQNVTADHIQGRKTGGKDEPSNLAMIAKSLNQMKSGVSEEHGDDSFNKLLNGSLPENGKFDRHFLDEGEDWTDKGEFASWVAERFLGSHFNEKVLPLLDTDNDGEISQEEKMEFLEDITQLGDMDNETLKEYMLDRGENDGVHLDLANLTKAVPRKSDPTKWDIDHETGERKPPKISKNSWRGSSGNSYNGTEFLDGFRKSMLVKMMTDVDLKTQLATTKAQMENAGNTTPKINKALQDIRKSWANTNLKMPMQGHASLFGLGRMNNENFVDWFRTQGAENLAPLLESHPELHEKLTEQLGGLENWLPQLQTYVGGDQPYEFGQNHPEVLNGMWDEWGRQLMRSKNSRDQLSPEEIDKFYEGYDQKVATSNRAIPEKDRWRDDEGNKLGPFSEDLSLKPNKGLL